MNHLPRVSDPRDISNVYVRRRSIRLKVYVHDDRKMTDQYVLDQSVIELGLQQCQIVLIKFMLHSTLHVHVYFVYFLV